MIPDQKCQRCGADYADAVPEGITYKAILSRRVVTVTHRLRFRRFTWTWLPENPVDRVREAHTDLNLCTECSAAVFMFAQGKTA